MKAFDSQAASAGSSPLARGILGLAVVASLAVAASHIGAAAEVAPQMSGRAAAAIPDFAAINERAASAVVNVRIAGVRKVSGHDDGEGDDDDATRALLDLLHRRFGATLPPVEVPVQAEGSGFIVSPDGIVLTNAHVVQHASEVVVRLTDRREFNARVLGTDTKTDVAVLKIDATGLPAVRLGDPTRLHAGDWVLAIGSPFGLENTLTAGIVSALGRSLPDDSAVRYIQTDVPINPGNSGGPLFDTHGEVVGINAQIYSRSGGYMGLSFAIPIDVAASVERQILATGRASHARLGVTAQDLDAKLADAFRLDRPDGALVSDVQQDSPAGRAGVALGDVVLRIDGKAIVASGDLSAAVAMHAPGDRVRLDVWRDGAARDLHVTLADGGDPVATKDHADDAAHAGKGVFGLALRPLSPGERRAAGTRGLLIADVSGKAVLAGLRAGDLLLGVGGKPVDTLASARSALASTGPSVALLVQRGRQRLFVPIARG